MARMRSAFAFIAALWLVIASAYALDAAVIGQAQRAAETLRADLTRVIQELRNPSITEDQLSVQRLALEKIRTSAVEQSLKLADPIREVNQQIASLGPAPESGKTDPPSVAQTRADLKASLDQIQTVKSQLDVIAVEAEQQAGRVGSLQRDHFFERIFDRNRSIINPALWYDTWVGLGVFATRLAALFRTWWSDVSPTATPLVLLLIPPFVAIFIGV
jgi:potassium efflux system protein